MMTYSLRSWGVFFLAAFMALAPLSAHAEIKIAIVDVQAILQKSAVAKNIKSQMDARLQSYQKEVGAQEDKLRKSEQELIKQRAVLKPEEVDEKRRNLQQQAMNVQRDVDNRKRTLDYGFNKAMNSVLKKMTDIVSDICKERGVNLVLARQQVVFAESGMDITDEVLKKLDSEMSSLKVDFSPPPQTSK